MCVCVCVCDRAACVCVTVLDVFRQARAGFYLHFFNSAVVVSTGGDCNVTRIRSLTLHFGQKRNLYLCDEFALISSMWVHHFRARISCEMTDFNGLMNSRRSMLASVSQM